MTPTDHFPNLPPWVSGFPGAVTVSAADGTILYLNDQAAQTFATHGGRDLVGTDLMACHNEHSQAIIRRILTTGEPNTYTIEKRGVKKLIHQAVWRENGEIAGLIEVSIVLPGELPHFVRG